ESPVAVEKIDIARAVGCRPAARLPNRSFTAVGSDIQNRGLRQGVLIIGHDPAVVWAVIAMRCPGGDHLAIQQQQPRPLLVLLRIESRTWGKGRRDRSRAVELLGSGRHVQRVETLE